MKLPDLRQRETFDCGDVARNVALLAAGWPKRFVRSLPHLAHPDHGTCPRRLKLLLRRHGVKTEFRSMTLRRVEGHLAAGRPVIAVVQDHYVVIANVSDDAVTYHDPYCGMTSKTRANFLDWWEDTDRAGKPLSNYGLAVWRKENDA